ncbi:MAG: LysE family transporter [Kofleriaceae bacterium]|nr:LysE family transporter [Kofleriaceae bacterium]
MQLTDLVTAVGLGLALGVVTGLPLGVVNAAVLELASRGQGRRAAWLGVGGAVADVVHAGLAFLGLGALVSTRPWLARWLAVAAAIVVLAYAGATWRQRRRVGRDGAAPGSPARALLVGLMLTLPNPAPLAAWAAVAAALPVLTRTPAGAIAGAIAVGVGSATWFVTLARIGQRWAWLRHPWCGRAALLVLVAVAALGVVRAV